MDYTIIEVPDKNDSMSRIVIGKTAYQIRFTYNDTGDFWKFGLYTSLGEPIAVGFKIVPNFPLNVFCGVENFPDAVFVAFSKLDRIGRDDFKDGKAQFVYALVESE